MSSNTLHTQTPDIIVLDNRSQPIRRLRYCRSEAEQAAEERIERQCYAPLGHLAASTDARFFAGGTFSNFQYQASLSGGPLHTQSVDAGDSWSLPDAEGRPHWLRDARGTEHRFDYDVLGRLVQRRETLEGATAEAICERLIYGETAPDADLHNLRGQLRHHYDTAGLLENRAGFALSGAPLQQSRRLLPPDATNNWIGEDTNQWQMQLETEEYVTHWQYDASGQLLTQTDAKGHRQRQAYDIAGSLKASWVQLQGKSEQQILKAITYSAAGQKLNETAGNDVVTEYTYEPETQRLLGINTIRPEVGDRKTLLQKLRYEYDPVGNVTAITNEADAARFFKNQRVLPEKQYQYDSLYQLIQASGCENASPDVDHDDPAAIVPLIDSTNLVNYTRVYQYDAGGNLTQIQHNGAQNFTRQLVVSSGSNHAALKSTSLTPETVRARFDACGNQQQLDNGPSLQWDGLNQLQHVITIARADTPDQESYRYAAGLRVRKTVVAQASGAEQRQDVLYLPGLELRRNHSGAQETENLEVLTIGAAGRCQVRVLNWLAGKPDEIANQQARYSLDDPLGSCTLELDGSADILTGEEYYPYGGTAVRTAKNQSEAKAKTIRYSGKERDATGLYYYGYRYYQPWLGRWLNPDPAGIVDGLNLFRMVRSNPVTLHDNNGLNSGARVDTSSAIFSFSKNGTHANKNQEKKRAFKTYNEKNNANMDITYQQTRKTGGLETKVHTSSEHIILNNILIAGGPRSWSSQNGNMEKPYFAKMKTLNKNLESAGLAYQENDFNHKAHVGTGGTPKAGEIASAMNDNGMFVKEQKSLIRDGDVSGAIQFNQLGYAHSQKFVSSRTGGDEIEIAKNKIADDSYLTSIRGIGSIYLITNDPWDAKKQEFTEDAEVTSFNVTSTDKLESAIARLWVAKLDYPTVAEVKQMVLDYSYEVPSTLASLRQPIIDSDRHTRF